MFMLASLAPVPLDSGPSASEGLDNPSAAAPRNRYIGAKACKSCHNSEAKGHQFDKWSEAVHAQAWEVLGSDRAKEVGAEHDVKDPQKDDACLKCHVTAHGMKKNEIKRGFDIKLGVQCESCHGPGEAHSKARFAAASAGDADPKAYVQVADDEILRQPTMENCQVCHNEEESPTYKPFCYKERRETIAHLNPLKPRTDEEKAALGADCKCEDCAEKKEK